MILEPFIATGQTTQQPIIQDYNHGQAGLAPAAPPIRLPDLSRPPPGFVGLPPTAAAAALPPAAPVCEADLTPTVPYYELPAGLMAPLVNVRMLDMGDDWKAFMVRNGKPFWYCSGYFGKPL